MKLVALKEVFEINYGTNLGLNNLELSSSVEGVPFVSRTSKNNGVSAYVKEINNIAPNPGHTLSVAVSGSVLETFYQDEKYYSGFHLFVLSPLMHLTKIEMLFYCAYIRANKYRFNYGRQANRTLGEIKVPSPQAVRERSMMVELPKQPSADSCYQKKRSLNDATWSWFFYKDIFNIVKGKRLTKADMLDGDTRFIGAINSNNGVSAYIDSKPIFDSNTITVNYDGNGVAEAYFQPKEYWALDSVNVLIPKFENNPYIGMFLCSLIKKEKYRFNYGRKWHKARMELSKIKLPVDDNGRPDWQFMEDYIKSLPYSSNL